MGLDLNLADKELKVDEGTGPMKGGNFVVYDDANGKPIVPGSVVKGHPTIGNGIALDVRGITQAENLFIVHDAEADMWSQATRLWPWMDKLDPVRQVALLSMAYNLGIHGLGFFPLFLSAMEASNWQLAVSELKNSKWWNQVGGRAVRIANMILTGKPQV